MNNKITIRQTIILFALTLLVFHPFFTAVEAYASTDKNEIEDIETTTSENDSTNEEEEHTLLIEEELDEEELIALCKDNEKLEEIIITSEDSEEPIIVECASLEDELENDEEVDMEVENEDLSIQDNDNFNNKEVTPEKPDTLKDNTSSQKADQESNDSSTKEESTAESKESQNKSLITTTNKSVKKYSVGDNGPHVIQLKKDLTKLGYGNFPKSPTGVYGTVTSNVVKQFQKDHKLNQTGSADSKTLQKIKELLVPNLPAKEVVQLKKDLTALGYGNFPKNPSGVFGNITSNVVKQFQKDHKLNQTGNPDSKTLQKIKELLTPTLTAKEVVQLKKDLTALGYGNFPKNPSGVYGTVTTNVVKKFQKDHKLSQTGNPDSKTLQKIKELLTPTLTAKEIVQLKKDLTALGYGNFPKNPSGVYGNITSNVVKKFQKDHKLNQTGNPDSKTLQKIKELLTPTLTAKEIVQLKKDLTALGYGNFPKNPSGVYGTVTTNVVKKFQKDHKLSQTGNPDSKTLQRIKELLTVNLNAEEIIQLKKDLTVLGYGNFPKNPSGVYGTVTTNVVKQFQKSNGLIETGIYDLTTHKLLNSLMKKNKITKIFIDPGHGGSDPGASANGLREKDLTLQIAKAIRKHLEATYKNIEIMMSRTTDKYVSLQERTDMANKWGADYFISVHINSFTQASANGFETFIHNGKGATAEDKRIQNIVHDSVAQNIPSADRGKKEANFHVLRESNMPSMLLEYLFITNKNDAANLKKSSFIDKLGKLTAQGLGTALKLAKK